MLQHMNDTKKGCTDPHRHENKLAIPNFAQIYKSENRQTANDNKDLFWRVRGLCSL